jgi:hypothetical protein
MHIQGKTRKGAIKMRGLTEGYSGILCKGEDASEVALSSSRDCPFDVAIMGRRNRKEELTTVVIFYMFVQSVSIARKI